MKCDKCGHDNSEYDIICENCGSPLQIEKNVELQKKYHNKQKAIDIEAIEPESDTKADFDKTKKTVFHILLLLVVVVLGFFIVITYNIIKDVHSKDILTQYKQFIEETELGVLYFGNDKDTDLFLKTYSDNYEFSYLYISTDKITRFKKNRIKDKLSLKKLSNTLVIIEKGKVIANVSGVTYKNKDKAIKLLQTETLIPYEIGDSKQVLETFNTNIKSMEPMMLYIANDKTSITDKHNEVIKKFCNDYSINYSFVEGYYLTDKQKLRILQKLKYSDIKDELVVIVDEGEIKYVVDSTSGDENYYFDLASTYGIIDTSSSSSLKGLTFPQVKEIINSDKKSIILFDGADCDYCERVKPILGKIGIQNNITIYRYVVNNNVNVVEKYLSDIGYNEGKIIPPLVVISEKGKLLDYIVGLSDKTLYEEKLRKLGVIR